MQSDRNVQTDADLEVILANGIADGIEQTKMSATQGWIAQGLKMTKACP